MALFEGGTPIGTPERGANLFSVEEVKRMAVAFERMMFAPRVLVEIGKHLVSAARAGDQVLLYFP